MNSKSNYYNPTDIDYSLIEKKKLVKRFEQTQLVLEEFDLLPFQLIRPIEFYQRQELLQVRGIGVDGLVTMPNNLNEVHVIPYTNFNVDELKEVYFTFMQTLNEHSGHVIAQFHNKCIVVSNQSLQVVEECRTLLEAIEYVCKQNKWSTSPIFNS